MLISISKIMAMSSTSMTNSTNSKSPNGLTIGHKIYFEDMDLGAMPKSATGSLFAAESESPNKKMKGVIGVGLGGHQHLQQPPKCQVEGCNVDLSDVKGYYSKHKVCIVHSKSVAVIVGGVQKRFCQQCSRFHQLPEFDQEKRSCRRRLADHNDRRRKPPPMPLLSSCYGASSMFDTRNQDRRFLLDFSKTSGIPNMDRYPRTSDKRSLLQTQSNGKLRMHQPANSYVNPPSNQFLSNEGSGETSFPCQEIPLGEFHTGGVSSDSSCALSLLSSEPWGSTKNGAAPDFGMNPHNPAIINHPQGSPWGLDGSESVDITQKLLFECDPEHCQIPQHVPNQYAHEVGLQQKDGRQDTGAGISSRLYESV